MLYNNSQDRTIFCEVCLVYFWTEKKPVFVSSKVILMEKFLSRQRLFVKGFCSIKRNMKSLSDTLHNGLFC